MPSAAAIVPPELLPPLSMLTFYKFSTQEVVKLIETLYEQMKAKEGVENACNAPMSACDFLNILQLLGYFAPSAEFIAPPGVLVENGNEFFEIPPGECVCVIFVAKKDEVVKIKHLDVGPLNLTAEDSVDITQTFDAWKNTVLNELLIGPRQGGCCTGSFTVFENITLLPSRSLRVCAHNLDLVSPARVNFKWKVWRTP